MTVPAPVLEWLSQQLSHEYVDPPRCFADVTQVLLAMPSLAPKTDVYTAETGHSALLLNLTGPLPTVIAGHTYGIPIEVWVPKMYPAAPPLVYVRPTPAMRISPSSYVDTNGKCVFNWSSQAELIGVLRMLQEVFSFAPPVYAVQQPSPAQAPPVYSPQPGPSTGPMGPSPAPTAASQQSESVRAPEPYKPVKDIMNSITDPVPLPPLQVTPEKTVALANIETSVKTVSTQILSEETAKDSHALRHADEVLDWIDQALDDELTKLASAKQQHETNIRLLNERISQAESLTASAQAQAAKNLSIEDLVLPETPQQAKLLTAVVEDRAIADVIHALGKILDNESMSVDVFVKNVRSLAREQFLARATALECI